jgi:hypothetical protein
MNGKVYYHKFPNGKGYIGITTKEVQYRLKQHIRSGHLFHKAIKKYGVESIVTTVLEEGIDDIYYLNEREQYYISLYDTYNNGYNLTLGGDSLYVTTKGKTYKEIYGHERSILQREKMSAKQKGRVFTDAHKDKLKENHADVSGSKNPKFKHFYFLSPLGELFKADMGVTEFIRSMGLTDLLSSKKFKNKSHNEGWSYKEYTSFDNEDDDVLHELKTIQHSMWSDMVSHMYRYNHYISEVTVIDNGGNKTHLYTKEDIIKWCKTFGHSYDRFCNLRAGKTDKIGPNSSLYGYTIEKGIK